MNLTGSAMYMLGLALAAAGCWAADAAGEPRWDLPEARSVHLQGALGEAFERGVARLGEDPYQSVVFLRSDVSFEMDRWFTNYSGDISGRFIEIASQTSPPGEMQPAALAGLLESVTEYQRPDGHYGIDIDWSEPLELADAPTPRKMPIFWGNGRLLIGLLEAWRNYGDARLLDSARRMGDFYLATADELMDPARDDQYRATGSYAPGYVTCYFHGMEGLVGLYAATGEAKYLAQAERMAEFMKRYDELPLDHSHGNLSAYHAIMMLHRATGKTEYLERATARWEEAMADGYVWPTGGVGEHFKPDSRNDEGCSEADLLRLHLDLWEATGQTRYLDAAERLLLNHYAMNRLPNGGYGHHVFECDADGPLLMEPEFTEAVWCCTFHGLAGMNNLKRYLAAGRPEGITINFLVDFTAPVKVGARTWNVEVRTSEPAAGRISIQTRVEPAEGGTADSPPLFIRVPGWAETVEAADADGNPIEAERADGYIKLVPNGGEAEVSFTFAPRLEDRRMEPIVASGEPSELLSGVVVGYGPRILMAAADEPRPRLLLPVDANGRPAPEGLTADGFEAELAVEPSGADAPPTVLLTDWEHLPREGNVAFVFDVTTVRQGDSPGEGEANP